MKIGLYGIGLDTYWPQFKGLRARLTGYQRQIAKQIESFGADVVDAGLVDNPARAQAAASLFRREEVDVIFLYVSTYALSSTVLPVVQRAGVSRCVYPARESGHDLETVRAKSGRDVLRQFAPACGRIARADDAHGLGAKAA